MKLTDYKPNAARHIMLYGPPKSGKTAKILQLAEHGYKLWFVDGEDGIKTAWAVDEKGNRLISDKALENVELIRVPDNMHYPIMIETVLKIVKGGDVTICHSHGKVGCPICGKDAAAPKVTVNVDKFTPKDILVIETCTQLGNSAISHIKKKEIAANSEDVKMEWDDWRKQGFLLDRIFSIVQNAPWNCIVSSHEELAEMEDKRMKIVPKMGTANFSKTAAKYFDDVVYCDKINNKLKAFSNAQYKDNVITGSRTGKQVEKDGSRGLIELFE